MNWADGETDAAGNMKTIPKPNDLANGYTATYDAWNRLVKIVDGGATVAEYEYDGLNQRIQKIVNSGADTYDYYYNMKWQAVVEFKNGSANRMNLHRSEYIDSLAVSVTASARHYYLCDANYNVTVAITPSAGVAERYSYSPYGKVTYRNANFTKKTTQASTIGNDYLFTGRRLDAETGFYYFRNRYYSAEMGRFVTVDPIRYNGSKWNLFQYVTGRPTTTIDPSGLEDIPIGTGACRNVISTFTGSQVVNFNLYKKFSIAGEKPIALVLGGRKGYSFKVSWHTAFQLKCCCNKRGKHTTWDIMLAGWEDNTTTQGLAILVGGHKITVDKFDVLPPEIKAGKEQYFPCNGEQNKLCMCRHYSATYKLQNQLRFNVSGTEIAGWLGIGVPDLFSAILDQFKPGINNLDVEFKLQFLVCCDGSGRQTFSANSLKVKSSPFDITVGDGGPKLGNGGRPVSVIGPVFDNSPLPPVSPYGR